MSLKSFHIVFVAAVLLFCLGFGTWNVLDFRARGERESLVMAALTLAGSPLVIWYGAWFLRKLRNVGFM